MTQNKHSFYHIRRALELIPTTVPAMALMRHAKRDDIQENQVNEALLTPQGEKDSLTAGGLMKGRICRLLHSPVRRCLQTAERLKIGGESDSVPEEWMGLKYHIYADNPDKAKETLKRLVSEKMFYETFVERMSTIGDETPYPGFNPPLTATAAMCRFMLSHSRGGICVGVTHDWLVNVAASYATGKVVNRADDDYADYLDALFVWKADAELKFYHKGKMGSCPPSFARAMIS